LRDCLQIFNSKNNIGTQKFCLIDFTTHTHRWGKAISRIPNLYQQRGGQLQRCFYIDNIKPWKWTPHNMLHLTRDMTNVSTTCYSTRILDIFNQRTKVVLSTCGLFYRMLSITFMSSVCDSVVISISHNNAPHARLFYLSFLSHNMLNVKIFQTEIIQKCFLSLICSKYLHADVRYKYL